MKHIAFIMDGNGRWAEQQGLPRVDGHLAGAKAVMRAISTASILNIPYISFYAFSSENFKRDEQEISAIFSAVAGFLSHTLLPIIKDSNYQIRFIGDLSKLPDELLKIISKVNSLGLNNDGLTIIIALAYGGRNEIAQAFNRLMKQKFINSDTSLVSYNDIEKCLDTAYIPDPNIVVRYGGYQRLSNFMPLQTVYSELFFLEKLWPDFEKNDIDSIIKQYTLIKRNFGDIPR